MADPQNWSPTSNSSANRSPVTYTSMMTHTPTLTYTNKHELTEIVCHPLHTQGEGLLIVGVEWDIVGLGHASLLHGAVELVDHLDHRDDVPGTPVPAHGLTERVPGPYAQLVVEPTIQ